MVEGNKERENGEKQREREMEMRQGGKEEE